MGYFLYILKSKNSARYYIGITANTEKRLGQHNNGRVRSTKAYRPWIIAHVQIFSDKTTARHAEINLKKNYQARKALFNEIEKV